MLIDRSKFFLRTVLLALAVPVIGLPATFTLPSGPTVSPDGSTSGGVFTLPVTVNGDSYVVSWDFSASFPTSGPNAGTNTAFNPTVTYTGGAATAQADVIEIKFDQLFTDPLATNWDGTYSEHIPLKFEGAGAGSTATGELSYDGMGIGLLTFGGPDTLSKALTGLNGTTLTASYDVTYDFAAGTTPGASATSSTTPEPAEALPVGLGLAGIGFALTRRNRKKSA
jgi:hypothetical protein